MFSDQGMKGLCCPVQVTIKTHKPLPKVQILHASSGSPLEGFSRILHLWLSEVATGVSHLVPNTSSLLKLVRIHRLPRDCAQCKFDVKVFICLAIMRLSWALLRDCSNLRSARLQSLCFGLYLARKLLA